MTDWTSPRIVRGILATGIALRFHQYLANRSLWLDESMLALNLIERDFRGLLQPLSNDQAAPIGFMMVEKAAITLLGPSEYALRLFPLLAGVAAMWLLYRVARLVVAPDEALIAVTLFAVLDAPIYFSSEVKQYSSDMAVALALVWVGLVMLRQSAALRSWVTAALAGAISVWLSHPAVFVLAAVGLTCLIATLRTPGRRGTLLPLLCVGTIWIASFLLTYWSSLRSVETNTELQQVWVGKFVPLPASVFDIQWWLANAAFLVREGFGMAIPAAFAAVIGVYRLSRSAWQASALLVLPALFAFIASLLHFYPFHTRLILFLLPLELCVVAAGLSAIVLAVRERAGPLVAATIIVVVLLQPLAFAAFHLAVPRTREEGRQAIASYLNRRQPGDSLYVYYGAEAAYRFYTHGLKETGPVVVGCTCRSARTEYRNEVDRLRGRPRVWVLISHVFRGDYGEDEGTYLLAYLDSIGARVATESYPGAWLYLYDLSARDESARVSRGNRAGR